MTRSRTILTSRQAVEGCVRELMARHDAGEDPRHTIRRLNARIVECHSAGVELPAPFLRLSRTLAAECVAQAQAR